MKTKPKCPYCNEEYTPLIDRLNCGNEKCKKEYQKEYQKEYKKSPKYKEYQKRYQKLVKEFIKLHKKEFDKFRKQQLTNSEDEK